MRFATDQYDRVGARLFCTRLEVLTPVRATVRFDAVRRRAPVIARPVHRAACHICDAVANARNGAATRSRLNILVSAGIAVGNLDPMWPIVPTHFSI